MNIFITSKLTKRLNYPQNLTSLNKETRRYISHSYSGRGLKGTVINWTCHFIIGDGRMFIVWLGVMIIPPI